MFATATLLVPRGRAVRVPQSALVMINDSLTVYVEVAPWHFERRSIEAGAEDEQGVRVLRGLEAGQRIIVRGAVLLND
jgi:cobalt-zinc-cadmium efflux system membrane fusion protein